MVKNLITKSFLLKLKRNQDVNALGENLFLVAEILKSKLANKFKKINIEHAKKGYLTQRLMKGRYELYKKLKEELKKVYPKDYTKILKFL